jgi:hypothetical protein
MVDEGANGTTFSPIWMENDVYRIWRWFESAQDLDKAPRCYMHGHLVRSCLNETVSAQGRIDRGPPVV